MSELLSHLSQGMGVVFLHAVQWLGPVPIPMNVLFCLLGALVGTLVGVLPGIGTVATIAMLLPITFGLPPVGALIMLAGIYYGAQYGGSTTPGLVKIPGQATPGVTRLDRRHRLVLRRLRVHRAGGRARRAAHRSGAAVRPGRIFRADGARPHLRSGAGERLGAQIS